MEILLKLVQINKIIPRPFVRKPRPLFSDFSGSISSCSLIKNEINKPTNPVWSTGLKLFPDYYRRTFWLLCSKDNVINHAMRYPDKLCGQG